jgi:hypothetical protein
VNAHAPLISLFDRLLPAALDVAVHELRRILFEEIIDLVEKCVQLFPPLLLD